LSVETVGRAVGLYRRTAWTRSAIVLVIANVIPIIGVLFFGWSLITILVLYWLENGIVGFWNIPKIALAQGSLIPGLPDAPVSTGRLATTPALARLTLVPRAGLAIFFLVHYGIFWFGHGVFVFALPTISGMTSGSSGGGGACDSPIFPEPGEIPMPINDVGSCASGSFGEMAWGPVLIGAVALFLSHGASFLMNYIANGEYQRTSAIRQMGSVYGRVVVLHLTILFGGFVVASLGAPIGALLVLVVLKTAFDLGLHRREHAGLT
jgi:hypothetical protein